MATYFYGRVSSAQQNLARQIEAAKSQNIPEENCYYDKISGAKFHRPQLDSLLEKLQKGDTLGIKSFDRLGRSTQDLLSLVERFQECGVNLVCLDSNIDTSTPLGKFFFTVNAASAECERAMIRERQAEGIAIKIATTGRSGGRRPIPKEKMDIAISEYLKGEKAASDICRIVGISRAKLYNELNKRGITRD